MLNAIAINGHNGQAILYHYCLLIFGVNIPHFWSQHSCHKFKSCLPINKRIASKMFTNAQTLAFFTDQAQMGLSQRTVNYLNTEGINDVDDLIVFKEDGSLKQLVDNAKRPPRIPDPTMQLKRFPKNPLSSLRLPSSASKLQPSSHGCMGVPIVP